MPGRQRATRDPAAQGGASAKKNSPKKPKNRRKAERSSGKAGSEKKGGGRGGGGGGVRGHSQSCHQCRQSIHSCKGVSEVKSGRERLKCSTCTRFWCEQCLHNRYGIDKATVVVATWVCPVCSKNCNCSLCRRKEGKLATGILTPLVKNAGFGSVSDFLTDGTDDIARMLQWQSPKQPADGSHASGKKGGSQLNGQAAAGQTRKRKRRESGKEAPSPPSLPPPSLPPSSLPPPSLPPPSLSPPSSVSPVLSGDSENAGCQGDDGDCHGNEPKQCRVNHSNYSITMEVEPVLMGSEVNSRTKVVITIAIPNSR